MEGTTTAEDDLDKCCDICGDVGAIHTLVTCTQCKISREHLYCMRTLRYDYPESWHCEDCESLMKASSLNNPCKFQHDSAGANMLPDDLKRNPMYCEKKMKTSKVKPLSAEDVIMLTSGARAPGSPIKSSFHPHTILRRSRSILKMTPMMTGGIPPKSNSHLATGNSSLELAKQLRPPIAQQHVALLSEGPREKDATRALLKKHTQSQEGQLIIAINNIADTKGARIAVGKETIASTYTSYPIVDSGCVVSSHMKIPIAASRSISPLSDPLKVYKHSYIPASEASWKGSFNVLLNEPKKWEVSDAIQAHPPSRVRKKVYETSMLMPEVLKFEVVQQGSLWTSLFENYTPDYRDIGIYLFPSTSERCKNYMLLLEHMGEQDLVLRNYMDDLELLIFTSKVLHTDCQRWNDMYFLWGLFRRMKLTTTIQPEVSNCHDEGNNRKTDDDMEIDMVGGQHVGRLDVVVPRTLLPVPLPNHTNETYSNIPLGFEKMHQPTGQRSCASAPNHAKETTF